MRLLSLLVIIFLGQGTSAQSCNNSPLLGCHLDPTPCNNRAGTCKDCCRSEIGEVEMSSEECTGQCKCCGIPDEINCPIPLCGCGPGYTTQTAKDPITNCEKCFCVPENCSRPPLCGCPPPYRTDYYQSSTTDCLECKCVLERCPQIQCPVCQTNEKELYGTDIFGCPFCVCEARCVEGSTWPLDCNTCTCIGGQAACTLKGCPPDSERCSPVQCPSCESNEKQVARIDIFGCSICVCEECPQVDCPISCPPNQQLVYGDEDGCPTCSCGQCPAIICGCSPNDEEVEVQLPNGCKGCLCVPKQDTSCPDIHCPICNGGQNEVHGVGADGCPFCICGGSCLEGATWNQGCAACTCSNGVISCTETGCLPPAPCPIAECPQCLQGQSPVYTEDSATGCVTCSCSPDERCVDGHSKPASDGCNTCTCVDGAYFCTLIDCSPLVRPKPCTPRLCGCLPGYETEEIIEADGCPGCVCIKKPAACPGGFCKSSCDIEAGEYVGPFSTCLDGEFCCNSPETAPCANDGESCGAQCTCRTVCEQGEYEDGFCPTDLQDVGQCSKCKTCAENPVCIFGCQGEQVIKTKQDPNGCLECECLCPPLDDCSPSCTRSLDESTGCFKCYC